MKITVLHNQTLFDLAIQYYGTATIAFDLAAENDLGLSDELKAGQELIMPRIDGFTAIVDYYSSKGIKPTTSIAAGIEQGGIGFMIIEQTFIVS